MRYLLILSTLFMFITSSAQEAVEKNIEVGMQITIKPCRKDRKQFESMDLYIKTRYPDSGIKVDSTTGEGIFESFFAPGDFEAKRLPCEYGNKKYKVAALRVFNIEGEDKRVMVCYTNNPLTMIWIEFDKAVEVQEIEW